MTKISHPVLPDKNNASVITVITTLLMAGKHAQQLP